ncbi:protein of unknown function [Catalinimonas alkaloidigena]|uniref:DUF4249 domain-containing protein n=1 Tax=Catalinimonas alkaloidigena TaxID=1075417 RepID=A0A1G9LBU8_9BACT|nr:DUF4249 domain-containing protein [Catalinimonas alkaloidigena]SDL59442.1 protein of unknown function [Catalinimonas alkaloidigena]
MLRCLPFSIQLLNFLTLCLLAACNLEKEVEIVLPAHQSELVVEAYLEPGKPYRLLLTQTQAYFDSLNFPFVADANVVIRVNEQAVRLQPTFLVDTATNKVYNYASVETVPSNYEDTFTLTIDDVEGRRITATTKLSRRVEIDSLAWFYNDRNFAYLLTLFTDDPNTQDYYRLLINRDSLTSGADVDILLDDVLLGGDQVPLATNYSYEYGDTLFVRLFHLDEPYYHYLRSLQDARSSNGNPFAQPSPLKSGVSGGYGVFTGLAYEQRRIVLE